MVTRLMVFKVVDVRQNAILHTSFGHAYEGVVESVDEDCIVLLCDEQKGYSRALIALEDVECIKGVLPASVPSLPNDDTVKVKGKKR